MRNHRFIRAALAATALVGLLAGPALAGRPDQVERHHASSIGPFNLGSCGDFDLYGRWDRVRSVTDHYDRAGNLVRSTIIVRYVGEISNGSDSTKYVVDRGHRTIIDDWVNEVTYDLGGAHHVTLPGHGIVYAQAGRQVWDWIGDDPLSRAGHADDPTVLCEFLD